MLRAWERATRDRTGRVIGGIDLSVFGTCTGSASGRVSEISSGLEAGFKSEARGRRIPPDELGAFPATFGQSWKERPGAAGRVEGIRTTFPEQFPKVRPLALFELAIELFERQSTRAFRPRKHFLTN